jgi:hypothetical protein
MLLSQDRTGVSFRFRGEKGAHRADGGGWNGSQARIPP